MGAGGWVGHVAHPAHRVTPPSLLSPHPPHRYLGTAPGRAGALATDAHAEALEAAVGVAGIQVERASHTLVAQTSHHVVLQAQSWELQDSPREGLPRASGFICLPFQGGTQGQESHRKSTCRQGCHHVNSDSQ